MASVFKDHSVCSSENGLRKGGHPWWQRYWLEGCCNHLVDVIGLRIEWQQWVVVRSGWIRSYLEIEVILMQFSGCGEKTEGVLPGDLRNSKWWHQDGAELQEIYNVLGISNFIVKPSCVS